MALHASSATENSTLLVSVVQIDSPLLLPSQSSFDVKIGLDF